MRYWLPHKCWALCRSFKMYRFLQNPSFYSLPPGVEAPAQQEAQILHRVRSSVPLTVRLCARSGAEKSPFQLVIHPFRMHLATLSVKHPAPPERDFWLLEAAWHGSGIPSPLLPSCLLFFFKRCSPKPAAYDGILLSFSYKLQVSEVISTILVCSCYVRALYSVKYSCWSNNCYEMSNECHHNTLIVLKNITRENS